MNSVNDDYIEEKSTLGVGSGMIISLGQYLAMQAALRSNNWKRENQCQVTAGTKEIKQKPSHIHRDWYGSDQSIPHPSFSSRRSCDDDFDEL